MLCTECRVPKYEPLDPEKIYTVVMPSYLVDGGDGFGMIKSGLLKHNTGRKQGSGCETWFTVIVVQFVQGFFIKTLKDSLKEDVSDVPSRIT